MKGQTTLHQCLVVTMEGDTSTAEFLTPSTGSDQYREELLPLNRAVWECLVREPGPPEPGPVEIGPEPVRTGGIRVQVQGGLTKPLWLQELGTAIPLWEETGPPLLVSSGLRTDAEMVM